MAKPIVLCVDDEPEVLAAVTRDLRGHLKGDYRIVKAGGGQEGIDTTRRLKERGDVVALFISDQRMPGVEGTDFLREAGKLYPEARKVLLTAYADTNAAIESINELGLDHYLMKPWDPPEENLFPVVDDLLDAWQTTGHVPYDGIRVAGTLWSIPSHDVKDFLARNRVPYQWLDVEQDASARALVEARGEDVKLPVVFMPDGTVLEQPDRAALASACGMKTEASQPFYDLIIIGGGPAGLAAAVYGASEGLKTLMIEREATGGQAGTSSRIENYLGFPNGVSGTDLAQRATTQAQRLGAELLLARSVDSIRIEGNYKYLKLDDGTELGCYSVLMCTGVQTRELDAPGVKALTGAGIYYGAAMTEAANFKDQEVYVLGGGNSAGQGAMFFARYAKKVTVVVRRADLSETMSQYLIDRIHDAPNMDVLPFHQIAEAKGENALETLVLEHVKTGERTEVDAKALFIFIGAAPRTEMLDGLVTRDGAGYLFTGLDLMEEGKRPKGWHVKRDPFHLETSLPGVFAAGDVRHGSSKRVAAAVGEGAVAVQLIHRYLQTV